MGNTFAAWGGTLKIKPLRNVYIQSGLYAANSNMGGPSNTQFSATSVYPYTSVPAIYKGQFRSSGEVTPVVGGDGRLIPGATQNLGWVPSTKGANNHGFGGMAGSPQFNPQTQNIGARPGTTPVCDRQQQKHLHQFLRAGGLRPPATTPPVPTIREAAANIRRTASSASPRSGGSRNSARTVSRGNMPSATTSGATPTPSSPPMRSPASVRERQRRIPPRGGPCQPAKAPSSGDSICSSISSSTPRRDTTTRNDQGLDACEGLQAGTLLLQHDELHTAQWLPGSLLLPHGACLQGAHPH